jgi:hypothetical protein
MSPMINFYTEQIDSSSEFPGEPSKTGFGYMYIVLQPNIFYMYLIMFTIAKQSFREAATRHVH